MTAARLVALEAVADRIIAANAVRVAVDGFDGAGKTIFADELGDLLRDQGCDVERVSVDGFHRPRQERYRRGRLSPEGFWLDSYDYDRFRSEVLDPFAPDGDRQYRVAVHDVVTDAAVGAEPRVAAADLVLIVDGIFLHRDELDSCWDFSIFLRVPFDVTFARMAQRDGCPADPADPANRRYVVGQQLYVAAGNPEARATMVIDNSDVGRPRIVG